MSAFEVRVPGGAAAPAVVLEVLVGVGQVVDAGEPVATLVIDKVDLTLAAPAAGRVMRTVPAGATLAADEVVMVLGPADVGGSAAPSSAPAGSSASVGGARAPAGSSAASRIPERARVEPLSRRRRMIAQTMVASLATSAQATTVMPVDVSELLASRVEHNPIVQARLGIKVSPFTMLARAVCLTLPRHPILNTWVSDDGASSIHHDYIDLGVAVDAPGGLVVVNVAGAESLSMLDIAQRIQDLAGRARQGSLKAEDVRRGTFTMSNTGSNGTTAGTPILHPPQVALLATYAIERRVVVRERDGIEGMAVRSMMNLALTYDHRIIDGADSGRFMSDLRSTIESRVLADELAGAAQSLA
jgi:pyruvate dehydrogenase E2 component (dihydrolipoamide acetyltransferase)